MCPWRKAHVYRAHARAHIGPNTPEMRDINTCMRARQALQWSVPNLLLSRYTGHVGLPLRPQQEKSQPHPEADSVGM